MPRRKVREPEVQALVDRLEGEGATIVDVLPAGVEGWYHVSWTLPGGRASRDPMNRTLLWLLLFVGVGMVVIGVFMREMLLGILSSLATWAQGL